MLLHEQIKIDSVTARKGRTDTVKIKLLVTLLGDLDRYAKDNGIENAPDEETGKKIKKFVEGAKEVIKHGSDQPKLDAEYEIEILTAYLPKQMTQAELVLAVRDAVAAGGTNLGLVMKTLKAKYAGLYDGAQAKAAYEAVVATPPTGK